MGGAGRVAGSGHVDDLEMRPYRPPLRWRQGGCGLYSKELSEGELEKLTRRYASEIAVLWEPDRDIPAPDVNTDARIMGWIMDAISMHRGYLTPGLVTGKPLSIGGTRGRVDATGRGVMVAAREALSYLKIPVEEATIVVQGYGNVGSPAAKLLGDLDCRIVGASDSSGGVYSPTGLDPNALGRFKEAGGRLAEY